MLYCFSTEQLKHRALYLSKKNTVKKPEKPKFEVFEPKASNFPVTRGKLAISEIPMYRQLEVRIKLTKPDFIVLISFLILFVSIAFLINIGK